ncbi:MAG: hypothetical protein KIT11_04515 [Fimbriimonadaceae bacterium]|nr:hypothetical protein [Fimbriimonadaceae bacterium]QYK56843.1 MAG: hypothetical protein KF733_05010 [Fimbriimonadaceae bacterium]
MLSSLALLAIGQSASATVSFSDGKFIVSGSAGRVLVPLAVEPDPLVAGRSTDSVTLKNGQVTVSFSKQGLKLTGPGGTRSTTLKEVPVSGKISSRSSNSELMAKVKAGERRLEVTGLSGYELMGDDLYLVARWAGKDGKTWLETLLRVESSGSAAPTATLVGKLPGFTTGRGVVDDVVGSRFGRLVVPTNRDGKLGCAEIAPDGNGPWTPLSAFVSRALPSADGTKVFGIVATGHKTFLVGFGSVNEANSYHTSAEISGTVMGFYDPHYLAYRNADKVNLVNLSTGATLELTPDSGFRYSSYGMLVWRPEKAPIFATLYDGSFRPTAYWRKPAQSQ